MKEAEGVAWVVGPWVPILGVSDPTKQYLWILSRRPSLAKTQLDDILIQLQTWGYDLKKMPYTER